MKFGVFLKTTLSTFGVFISIFVLVKVVTGGFIISLTPFGIGAFLTDTSNFIWYALLSGGASGVVGGLVASDR